MSTEQTSKFISCQAAAQWQLGNTDVFSAGDIDGDGRKEVLVFSNDTDNLSLNILSYFRYGDLSPNWASDTTYQMITMWGAVGQMPGGAWNFNEGDQYLCGDLDKDDQDEVIALKLGDPSDTTYPCYLGVFKWQIDPQSNCSTLAVQNSTICSSTTSGKVKFYYFSKIYIADIDRDGKAEIVAHGTEAGSGNSVLAVYRWDSSGINLLWCESQTGNGWEIGPTDRFYCADLKGDGQVEILAFKPGAGGDPCYIGVFTWNSQSNQLEAIWIASGSISNDPWQWHFNVTDEFYCADLNGDQAAEVICYKPQSDAEQSTCEMGVFQWDDEFQVIWNTIGSMSNGSWNLSPTDKFFCVDVNGNQKSEVVAFKQGDPCNNYLNYPCYLGVFAWNKSSLEVLWTTANLTPSWAVDLFNGIPSAGLTQFTTPGQQWAYQYISNYFDPDSNGNIRSQYQLSTSGDVDEFKGWAVDLREGKPPRPSDAPSYVTEQDWRFVQLTLAGEFGSVYNVAALIENMMQFALGDYFDQTGPDLNNCARMIGTSGPITDTLNYWPGQFFIMALWGMAGALSSVTTPGYGMAATMVGMLASIFGSALAEPSTPGSFNFAALAEAVIKLSDALNKTYNLELQKYQAELTTLLNDETKLQLVGYLAENAWQWQDGEEYMITSSSERTNRVSFYQQLLPVLFRTLVWYKCKYPVPCGFINDTWLPMSSPKYTYWAEQVDSKHWNVYLLCQNQPTDLMKHANDMVYPSEDLMNDLIDTLGVNEQEFFTAQKGWCNITLCDTLYPHAPYNKCGPATSLKVDTNADTTASS